MIIVIDNYDSFTWNLVDFLRRGKQAVTVFRNDEVTAGDLLDLHPKGILISPGPGRPEDSGISPEVLRLAAGSVPILGICLGHQLIGQHFGMAVLHGREPVHGKTHAVSHNGDRLFKDVPSPFQAMRYHSLVLSREDVPAELEVIAWTGTGEVMGIRHRRFPIAGLQFHPESILTEGGSVMVGNWLSSLG
jgi:anthranilate synthase/aminodeoxychorismate synthase-like glutamine amidotransferase